MPTAKTNRVAYLSGEWTQLPGEALIPGGCTYYRCYLPMHASRFDAAMGRPAWTSQYGFGVSEGNGKATFGYNVIVLKQLMDRWLPHQIEVAQALGQKIIVDVDDFYHGLHPENSAYHKTDPAVNKVRNRDVYEQMIRNVDAVVVSTPELLNFYGEWNPNIRMVRNSVYPQQFTRRETQKTKPVLGWVGALGYRSGDIETLREWLPDFLEEHDLLFHHSGHVPSQGDFAVQSGINPERLRTLPMQPMNRYPLLFTFDIGLVPLNDILFNRAKSFIKGLEYTASGIPFVAQALPEYDLLAGDGIGLTAVTADDWRRQVESLLDYRTRKRNAASNFTQMERLHTIKQREDEWRQVIVDAIES